MNQRQSIISVVVANPGITMREIAAKLGYGPRANISSITAQLSQLCQKKKLTKDGLMTAQATAPRFWPTPTSQVDERTLKRKPGTRQERQAEAKRVERAARRLSDDEKRASYASPRAVPPTPASNFRIVDPPRPKAPANPAGRVETVEEFIARGGSVQRLPTHFSGNPLRFDHSRTDVPMARRRPSTHARKAVSL